MNIGNKKAAGLSALMVFSFAAVATGMPGDIMQNIGLNDQVTATTSHQGQLTDNIDAEYNIKVYKNGELMTTTHNVLMDGEEMIEQSLTTNTGFEANDIAVGNGTAPQDADSSLDSEWSSCGLTSADAGSRDDTGDGTWNYTVTYDVTCDDVIVNTTAIKDSSKGSSIDYFAGADLGRDINPYSGDSITIEWSHTADDS